MRFFPKRLLILLVLLAALLVIWSFRRQFGTHSAMGTNSLGDQLVASFQALQAQENETDRTVWAKELLAERCGQVFEGWWDSLNAATNKLRVLESFPIGEIAIGKFHPPEQLVHGIAVHSQFGKGVIWSRAEWTRFLQDSERAGWRLAETEFRHSRFDTDAAGQPMQSHFDFRAHLLNPEQTERAVIEGELVVSWSSAQSDKELPSVKQVDARGLTIKTRGGEPPFVPVLNETIAPPKGSHFIDPLILYDLDGDGRSEIILAASNLVYRQRPNGRFEPGPLCRHSPGWIFTGVIADFDGDGASDFLCAKFEGLFLFKGSPQGTFDEPGRLVWVANPHLRYAQVITCGDIDRDGDLDVFVAQYKLPYSRGQMPTPYYDANDGDPSYLLLNDGQGNFTDATTASGLAAKRWRRSYSASFADLDGDGHLDLVVVSDFAGVDLYRNNGHGHFTEVTGTWVAEPHAFGMAHALADFNGDGRLDLLMIGMNSPTADRLNHLGLWRPGVAEDRSMRSRVAFGNRLLLAHAGGGFEQTSMNDFVARTGWSWGCAAGDFDNDGFPDLYIANGHQTRQSVRDYETEFWRHDIYAASSKEDAVASTYFQTKFTRGREQGQSYGGYEKNRFFFNQRGASFVEAGHLLGVALPEDSRGVVADDLDGDGRLDLLLTTFEEWPETKQTVRAYRNDLKDTGNWIGFRFHEAGGAKSPVGARVTVRYAGRSSVRQIVTGDSYRAQQANTVHFGLGEATGVDRVEVRWANGGELVLRLPKLNQYHNLTMPPEPKGP
jgi:hypothetical protein